MIRSAAVPAFVLVAVLAPLAARSQEAPSVRSTGQVEVALEPAKTARTVQVDMPEVGASATHEATQKRSEAVEHVFESTTEGRIEVRVAARDGAGWMSVYLDDSETPEGGTGWDKRAVMWTGATKAGTKVRVVTYVDADETPYRVIVTRGGKD